MTGHQRVLDLIERHDHLDRTHLHLLIALRSRQPRWHLIGRHRINTEIDRMRARLRAGTSMRRIVLADLL